MVVDEPFNFKIYYNFVPLNPKELMVVHDFIHVYEFDKYLT